MTHIERHQNGDGRKLVDVLRQADASSPAGPSLEFEQYAPPTEPERMQRLAQLTGDSIRSTCADASKAVRALVSEAEDLVAAIRKEAEEFCESLTDIGDAHADRIEKALQDLQGVTTAVQAERERVRSLLPAPKPEHAA